MIKLYDYIKSTASYRVRIALQIKNLSYEAIPVNLLKDGGEQFTSAYEEINPQHLVPTLIDDSLTISQSIAILEYLEEQYPKPALLPKNTVDRAYVRQLVQLIACDMHPLNNLRVLQYLKNKLKVNNEEKNAWYHHWLREGFTAFETLLNTRGFAGKCCYGDTPTFADVCLIPQILNANRFEFSMEEYPKISAINSYCLELFS